jgi:ABC-type Fe3+ transport system substrate-binding protein
MTGWISRSSGSEAAIGLGTIVFVGLFAASPIAFILVNSFNWPHPNAATLFLNWVTSKDGQEVVSRALLEPSRRVDVPTSLVPEYVLPQPGVKYDIDQYSEEWQREVAPKLEERLQKALGK